MDFFKQKKESFVMRSRAKTYLSDDTNGVSPKKWIGKCIYPYYVYFRKNRSEKSW